MKPIKTIIFDIGGVVMFTDFKELYKNFAERVGINPQSIEDYIKQNWSDCILGNISLEQFFKDISIGAKQGIDLQAVWVEEGIKIRTLNTELFNVISELRKKYIVGSLTNLTPARQLIDEHMGIFDHFEFSILSCVEHLRKPDAAFYNLALQKAGTEPEETVFIDDNEKNVIAANELGFKGLVYTDNAKLITDLKNLGVDIN